MKTALGLLATITVISACSAGINTNKQKIAVSLIGSWKLISGRVIKKVDTTTTDYTKDKSFIKIINDTHFAFLLHDLRKGKDSATATFVAGGGRYTLKDSLYTEHLEYCSDRQWENHDFTFTVLVKNDTLVQSGIEKVEETGENVLNTEKYVKIKN